MSSEALTAAPETDSGTPPAQPVLASSDSAPDGAPGAAGDADASTEQADIDGEAGEVDPDATLTVRALISTKEAGVVIGKGGQNVAELREKLGVKAGVTKVVPGVHDRVLSVSGSVEGIAKAYSLIGQNILDNSIAGGTAPDGTPLARSTNAFTSVRLLIAHSLMGTVIGRSGLKIKHIQDVSGARMVASKDMLPNSSERVVEVQGTAEAIRIAVLEIAKCLMEDKERNQGTMFYTPNAADGPGVLAAGGVGGLQGNNNRRPSGGNYLAGGMGNLNLGGRRTSGPNGEFGGPRRISNVGPTDAAPAGAAVTPGGNLTAGAAAGAGPGTVQVDESSDLCIQNISIPSDMVGCIIGKGGSRITEIRRLSGSRISIAKVPHDDTGERMFTIQGSAEANEKALFLLYNQLETEKERRTSTVAEEEVQTTAPAADQSNAAGEAPEVSAEASA